MRRILMITGLVLATGAAAPMASARDACQEYAHNRKVTGTVLGAVGGALVGHAIDDRRGAVIGGLGGAALGNNMARVRCNTGQRAYRAPARSTQRAAARAPVRYAAAAPQCRYEERAFYDENARLVRHAVRVCR